MLTDETGILMVVSWGCPILLAKFVVSTLLRGRVLSSFFSVSAWFWSLCLLTGLGGWVGEDVNVHCDC